MINSTEHHKADDKVKYGIEDNNGNKQILELSLKATKKHRRIKTVEVTNVYIPDHITSFGFISP